MRLRPRAPKTRHVLAAITLLGLLALADRSPVALTALRSASPATPGDADLTVLTFNVNFGAATDPSVLAAILDADADVVVLQETTDAFEALAAPRLRARFPHQRWRSPQAPYAASGAAILSRHPLRLERVSPSPVGWFEALAAVVETPRGPVQVVGVHLEPAASIPALVSVAGHHEREIEAHLATLALDGVPTIVAGDFNEERGGALRALERRGFEDAVARFEGGAPTWRWNVSGWTARLQLDHVLHRGAIEALDAEILDAGASDHLPVRVRFRRRGADPTLRVSAIGVGPQLH